MRPAVLLALLVGCSGADARFQLANQTPAARTSGVLGDGTSLRLKLIAAYLVEDVDPVTSDNIGANEMIWINPQCGGDIDNCNVDGMVLPAGPRITDYFDFSRSTEAVNADLNSENATVAPGSYRYARIELCKAFGQSQATVPTMMWKGRDMTAEQPFTSGDCGRTSLAFDPPLVLAAGDAVAITLGYDLDHAVMSGTPADHNPGSLEGALETDGTQHVFRACADVDADHRDCMDFPDFAPSAAKL